MIIKGDPTCQEQGRGLTWDKQRGWIIELRYAGLSAAIEQLVALNTAAESASSSTDGPVGTAAIRFANSELVTGETQEVAYDTWELVGNDLNKSIYEHRKALAIDNTGLAFVRNAVDEATKTGENLSGNATGAAADTMVSIFNHGVSGYDSYLESQFVLRRTTTVSGTYTGKLDFADTFKIWTTAEVKAFESLPTTIQFDLDEIDDALPSLATGGSLDGVFRYGWLKRTPTKSQTGRNMFNLTYEYWHAAWSTFLYDLRTP